MGFMQAHFVFFSLEEWKLYMLMWAHFFFSFFWSMLQIFFWVMDKSLEWNHFLKIYLIQDFNFNSLKIMQMYFLDFFWNLNILIPYPSIYTPNMSSYFLYLCLRPGYLKFKNTLTMKISYPDEKTLPT
jgi:hypothetical protein